MKNRVTASHQIMNCILLAVFGTLIFFYSKGMRLAGIYSKSDQRLIFLANVICYLLLFAVFAFCSSRVRFLFKNNYARIIILSYCATVIPNILSAYMLYSQPLMGVIRTFFWYGGWAFLLALILWGPDVDLALRLVHVFVFFGVVAAILGCLAVLFPSIRVALIAEEAVSERFELTRINILTQAVQFAFYFCLVSLCNSRFGRAKSIMPVTGLVVTSVSIFFISISRQAIIATCIVLLYFTIKYLRKQMRIQYLLIVLGILVLFFVAGGFDIVEQSLSSAYEGDPGDVHNVDIRLEGIRFFWNQLRDTNYIGTGKISTVHGGRNIILDAREEDKIYWVDVGILGTVGMYGFPAVLLVVVAFWKSFRDINLIKRHSISPFMTTIAVAIELFLIAGILQFGRSMFYELSAYHYSFIFFVLWVFSTATRHQLRSGKVLS